MYLAIIGNDGDIVQTGIDALTSTGRQLIREKAEILLAAIDELNDNELDDNELDDNSDAGLTP